MLSQARLFHCMHKLLLMNRQRITPPSMLVRSCFGATARRGRPARRSPVALSSGVCAAVLASMSGELGGCSGGRSGAAERGAAPPPAPGGAQAHAAVDEGRGCTLELTAGGEPSTPALGAPALSAVPARLLAGAASTSGGGPRKRRCVRRAGWQACCMGFGAALRAAPLCRPLPPPGGDAHAPILHVQA